MATRYVTDSIAVASHSGQVQISSSHTGEDYATTLFIVRPATARAMATALVEMADDAEESARAESVAS